MPDASGALLRLKPEGRGSQYSPFRGALESLLRALYPSDWPAALWRLVPRSCEVELTRLSLRVLRPGASALRLGFISDIHVGPTTPLALLERAFGLLAEAELDVLLLGGDYVFLDATEQRVAVLEQLVKRVPARRKLAVLGNHDLWTRHWLLERALTRGGAEILCNGSSVLQPASSGVTVIGLDDPWTGTLDVEHAFAGVGDSAAIVVLCHSPDALPATIEAVSALSAQSAVFYICGHTHGGQIATPWGPIIVPGPMGKLYPRGLYHVGPLQLYVSRGVGATELPIRAFARPEVVVIDLLPREE